MTQDHSTSLCLLFPYNYKRTATRFTPGKMEGGGGRMAPAISVRESPLLSRTIDVIVAAARQC
jgi:hypothetical protein